MPGRTSFATPAVRRCTSGGHAISRARLRSYFSGERQRPAVEAALGALAQVEWQRCGSELEAALDELRLLRELRPPANARGTRPDRACLSASPRLALGVRERADASRADLRPDARPPRRAGARRVRRRRSARCAPGPALAPAAARRGSPLRGCRTAARPDHRARAGRRAARRARARCAPCAPVSSCRRSSPAWRARSSSPAAVVVRRTVPRGGGGARLEVEAGLAEIARDEAGDARARRRRRAAPDRLLPPPAAARAPRRRARSRRDPRGGERGSLGCVSSVTDRQPDGGRSVLRPGGRGRRAKAEPARRRARSPRRPAAGRAPRRGRARPGRRCGRGRAVLQGHRRRRRAVRRRGEAPGRVLRGARQRRLAARSRRSRATRPRRACS